MTKSEQQADSRHNVIDLVGNTPLIALKKLPKALGIKPQIYAKLELYNQVDSSKTELPSLWWKKLKLPVEFILPDLL